MASATFARGGVLAKVAVPFRDRGGRARRRWWRMLRDRPPSSWASAAIRRFRRWRRRCCCGLPRMIHEQNGVLGRVNQLFATRVDCVACGTWPTALPEGVEGVHTGNPVRQSVLDRAGAPYIPPGDYPMSIAGDRRLARARASCRTWCPRRSRPCPRPCCGASARRPSGARRGCASGSPAYYAAAGIDGRGAALLRRHPAPADRGAAGHLALGRLVGGRYLRDRAARRSSIPFAAATGDHQTANARGLVDAGAAVLIPEARA